MKIVVNYLNFVFHVDVKTNSNNKFLNLVFQLLRNSKWHFGYTDLRLRVIYERHLAENVEKLTAFSVPSVNNKKFVLTSPKKSFFKNVFRSDLVWLMTYIDNFMLLRVAVGNDTTFHRNLVHFQSTQIYFSDVFRFFRHFCGNGLRLKVVNYFCQGNASYMFERIPNAPLFVINID